MFAVLIVAVGCFGFNTYIRDGLETRNFVIVNDLVQTGNDGGHGGYTESGCGIEDDEMQKLFANCARDKRGISKYALLGDSKAAPLFPGLVRTSTDKGRWLFIGGNGPNGAPVPLLSTNPIYSEFQSLTVSAVRAIANNKDVETVVLVTAIRAIFSLDVGAVGGNMPTYNYKYLSSLNQTPNYKSVFDGLDNTVTSFIKSRKNVIIVVDNPALPSPQDCISRVIPPFTRVIANISNKDCFLPLSDHKGLASLYRNLLIELQNKHPNHVQIFDITNLICDEEAGVCGPVHNGRLLYSYTDHISDYSAGIIGASLNTFLNSQ